MSRLCPCSQSLFLFQSQVLSAEPEPCLYRLGRFSGPLPICRAYLNLPGYKLLSAGSTLQRVLTTRGRCVCEHLCLSVAPIPVGRTHVSLHGLFLIIACVLFNKTCSYLQSLYLFLELIIF